jgi:hypothetical protein
MSVDTVATTVSGISGVWLAPPDPVKVTGRSVPTSSVSSATSAVCPMNVVRCTGRCGVGVQRRQRRKLVR